MLHIVLLAIIFTIGLQFLFKYFTIRKRPQLANNYHLVRRVQHLLTGLMILLIMNIVPMRAVQLASSFGALIVGCVTVTRFYNKHFNNIFIQNFSHILRPHEFNGFTCTNKNIEFPGAFYFISGVSFCLIAFERDIAILGILLVSVGDPSAAIIGIRFSRSPRLWGNKNVAGTFGSALIYTIVSLIYIQFSKISMVEQYGFIQKYYIIGLMTQIAILYMVGLLVELIPLGQSIGKGIRLDDNFFGMVIGCQIYNFIL